ncbi:MAG: 2'-5' RNA ligase family protein [Bacteriovoracaceae bacterium]
MKHLLFFILCFSMNSYAASDLIAINIALPPEQLLEAVAKKMNASTKKFHFDDTHFPHVTLVQGFVKKDDLPKIQKVVSELSLPKIELTSSKLEEKDGLMNLKFHNNPEVQRLHDKAVSGIKEYLQKSGDKDAFYEPSSVRKEDVDYAKNFVPEKSGGKYSPHMTMGVGTAKSAADKEVTYTFKNPQIFQIGEWGTARKKL